MPIVSPGFATTIALTLTTGFAATAFAFAGAMLNTVQDEAGRLPGLTTFLMTASGLTLFGIGSAFWGLVLGLLVHQIFEPRRSQAT